MRMPTPELVNCPHCQAKNPAVEDRCQACGHTLTVYIGPPERVPRRIGLGSLMLLIALIAVCLGVMREFLPLGVVLLLIVVPALFRTIQWAGRRAADGRPMLPVEQVGAFAASVAVVWLMLLMSGLALGMAAMLGVFVVHPFITLVFPEHSPAATNCTFAFGFVLGVTAALLTLYHLGRRLWAVQD